MPYATWTPKLSNCCAHCIFCSSCSCKNNFHNLCIGCGNCYNCNKCDCIQRYDSYYKYGSILLHMKDFRYEYKLFLKMSISKMIVSNFKNNMKKKYNLVYSSLDEFFISLSNENLENLHMMLEYMDIFYKYPCGDFLNSF